MDAKERIIDMKSTIMVSKKEIMVAQDYISLSTYVALKKPFIDVIAYVHT